MKKTPWEDNSIQFPRLLAELRVRGLHKQQYAFLCDAMDLNAEDIDEILERAEEEWQRIKNQDIKSQR